MAERGSTLQRIAAPAAGVALVLALAAAGWSVHRRLPSPDATAAQRGTETTVLRIVLRPPADYAPIEKTSLQLYPLSVDAARKEFDSERRPGLRFEEFLQRRLKVSGREPVRAEFDENGTALVVVPQGRWWIHATLEGPIELTWRLPVNVSGREKTVDLTPENIYTRAKSF